VKDAIGRHKKIDSAVCEMDLKQQAFAEHTLSKLEAKSGGNAVREQLFEQRQKAQAARSLAAVAIRREAERERERVARNLVQDTERKEYRRDAVLATKAEELAEAAESRRAKCEELEDRVRRQARRREYERERMREELEDKDVKFFAQRDALKQLHREKLAQRHKMEAEGKIGTQPTMRDVEKMSEPGPTSVDNCFYTMGQLGPGGKFGRVGTKPAPPSYTFGNVSENALPRVLDKSLMVEIVGAISPGPGTATPDIGSREILDKTNQYRRSPCWSMGHRLNDSFNKETLSKPGPGETHITDLQMEMTRYNSAPSFSFSTTTYQELRKQEMAGLAEAAKKPHSPGEPIVRERLSFQHSSRFPGPWSYNTGEVQTSLRRHRSLTAGVGVPQRFTKASRWLPIDTAPKDTMGPQKYIKPNDAPGPQKYRPTTSYLSTPLSF